MYRAVRSTFRFFCFASPVESRNCQTGSYGRPGLLATLANEKSNNCLVLIRLLVGFRKVAALSRAE
jgi:hypothetical protein